MPLDPPAPRILWHPWYIPSRMTAATPLPRRFGLLPATALNMTNMMGVGPFITIPLLMTALGGPQAMF